MKKPFDVRVSEVYVARALLSGMTTAPADVQKLFATEFAAGVSTALAALVDELRASGITDISVTALMERFNKQVSFALQVSTHGHDYYSETVTQWSKNNGNETAKRGVRAAQGSSAGDVGRSDETYAEEASSTQEAEDCDCIVCVFRKALEAAEAREARKGRSN